MSIGVCLKKVLLVDDSSLVRNDLKRLIASIPNLHLIGEALDSTTAIRLIDSIMPDIIILDINLIQGNGIEVLAKMNHYKPLPTVIVFTNHSGNAFRKAAEKLGASYFFDKNNEIESLIEIITKLSSSK